MSKNMVERVADALGQRIEAGQVMTVRDLALIAIGAMREPTEAMVNAAPEGWRTPAMGWRRMIDAALKP